MIQERDKE